LFLQDRCIISRNYLLIFKIPVRNGVLFDIFSSGCRTGGRAEMQNLPYPGNLVTGTASKMRDKIGTIAEKMSYRRKEIKK